MLSTVARGKQGCYGFLMPHRPQVSCLLINSHNTLLLNHHYSRACDRLHCTACNFHVIFFQEHIWDSRSDYLFFRNHVPDYERLKKNLVKKKGKLLMCMGERDYLHVIATDIYRVAWISSDASSKHQVIGWPGLALMPLLNTRL